MKRYRDYQFNTTDGFEFVAEEEFYRLFVRFGGNSWSAAIQFKGSPRIIGVGYPEKSFSEAADAVIDAYELHLKDL